MCIHPPCSHYPTHCHNSYYREMWHGSAEQIIWLQLDQGKVPSTKHDRRPHAPRLQSQRSQQTKQQSLPQPQALPCSRLGMYNTTVRLCLPTCWLEFRGSAATAKCYSKPKTNSVREKQGNTLAVTRTCQRSRTAELCHTRLFIQAG